MTTSDTTAFRLSLFGPLQVWVDGQPLPPLRSRKSLWLLALLALRCGQPVERTWLAETLWPDAYPDQAGANLNPVLSDLRRALGSQSERLQSPSRHTLCLTLVDAAVDVLAFDAAIASKTPAALEQVVTLYRGPLLEGCQEEWVSQDRSVRELDFLQALQTLAETALRYGDHEKSADYYRRAIALDPWRETAQRGLMEALAQSGDRNGALHIYREFAALLRTDPRAVPDEATKALYTRLQSEAKQQAASPTHSPPTTREGDTASQNSTPTVTGHLPYPITNLVGREDETEDVAARLKRSRLVTLTGPGGIGKTRLAVAVASQVVRDFAGGVWLVGLDALSDRQQVARQIALVFGLREESGRTCLEIVTEHLRNKRLLLVLDNCEHLLEECAAIAGHLLHECAGVRVLATSREALGITGEVAWTVPALTVPDPAHLPAARATLLRVLMSYEGVQLFLERAQAVQKTFTMTAANARFVAQICFRLEGIPLALELAAARVKAMTVEQIAARLDDRLHLLTGGSRTLPSRQQTLRGTLEWSYGLLGEAERVLLRRLSVFAGGWSLEGAEYVCTGNTEISLVVDLLASLVDKSLVSFEEHAQEGRYRFLETMRQYAGEHLEAADEMKEIRCRHRDYFLALAEKAEPLLRGPEQELWMQRLETERANLRAALEWSGIDEHGAEAALRLAGSLAPFWYTRGDNDEGRMSLQRALTRQDALGNTPARGQALNGAAKLAYSQGDYTSARTLYEQSLTLYRELGDSRRSASALGNLGDVAQHQGDDAAARIFYAEAQAYYEKNLSRFHESGGEQDSEALVHFLSLLAYNQGDVAAAIALGEQDLAAARRAGDTFRIALTLNNLGCIAYDQGDYASARTLMEESLIFFKERGNRKDIANTLGNLGEVAHLQGDYASAQILLEESLDIRREIGDKKSLVLALTDMSRVARDQGRFAQAWVFLEESLLLCKEIGDRVEAAKGMEEMALLLTEQDETRKAVCLWSAAGSLRDSIRAPLTPSEKSEYDPVVDQARTKLREDAFAAAWEKGRALTWEQAVEYALGETKRASLQAGGSGRSSPGAATVVTRPVETS